ncbi:MAG: DUF5996 family protein [Pseudomonadota bacterium]
MITLDLPPLPYQPWAETKDNLHLISQMVGKVRLLLHPPLNHWWHATLYPTVRGLSTGRIPYGSGGFEIEINLLQHAIVITTQAGKDQQVPLPGRSIAAIYAAFFQALADLGIDVTILDRPYDNASKTPFSQDTAARPYDEEAVTRFWRALTQIASVFEVYRGGFVGKQTPVQLFWHSFDMAVTRFSGEAHPLEGGTASDREAYSHAVISIGFWPGDPSFPEPAFYGYAYPEPAGLNQVALSPPQAIWAEKNGGALAAYRYEDLRGEADQQASLLSFLNSLYSGAAKACDWPYQALAR